ncbi:MAG: ATP-dependent sacrificial sulfur transferase LarE [Streptosporangiales bacterium]|nr:ATP-dependent sacrificial sulfur transferase LarE [Streptosporangiales bacterium]
MTLADARAGIARIWRELSARTGVYIDVETVIGRLGPPLEWEAAQWFPADQVDEAVTSYRSMYELAIPATTALPGAADAVDAVHRLGGRVVVITAKHAPSAEATLQHLGLDVDEVVGQAWAEAKGEALRERGGTVYVGDHPGDVRAARAADAVAVGVRTGGVLPEGADVLLDDLTGFGDWLVEHVLDTRLQALTEQLRTLGSVVVAFSGGADSAFVLAAAVDALGADHVLAATAVSGSLPNAERTAAAEFAASLGVRHVLPATDEISREGYQANAGDRCYFCKAELLEVLTPLAEQYGMAHVVTGTNADDAVDPFRPGIKAAAQRGASTPLRDAGLSKAQVRAASRRMGLSTWDKPAAACLSSRVAYGVRITSARLARVERAEAALREALATEGIPVRNLRVRDLGDHARVEVDPAQVPVVAASTGCVSAVTAAGFDRVEVDERGFRSGAMNELLA